jgi:hypothetical protein
MDQIPTLVGLDTEIQNAINSLIDGAPNALNTLNELAAAINDDTDYAGTVVLALDTIQENIDLHKNTSLNVHGTQGNVVGTTGTQTLTNKTISGASNTISNVAQASVVNLVGDLDAISTDVFNLQTDVTAAEGTIAGHTTSISTLNTNVSTLQGAATGLADGLVLKANIASPTFTGTVSGITKSMVGLGSVDNTADTAKPVSTATQTALDLKAPLASPTFTGTVSGVTKSMVGLGNVDNTTDLLKPISTATQTALDLKADSSAITELAQDAVNTALTAGTGITKTYNDAANTLTVAVDTTAIQARVAGVTDTEIGYLDGVTSAIQTQLDAKFATANASTTNITEGTNLYFTDERAQDAIGSMLGAGLTYNDVANTITVDSSALQLKVANVSDTEIGYLDGVTSAIQTQINTKAPIASPTFTGTVSGITSAMVGLGNVDNTTDASKPVSTSTQTALDLKANLASPTFTGTVSGITKTMVGLGSVDNTADSAKPVSTATQTALDLKETVANVALKAPLASPTFTGTVSGITKGMVGLGLVDNTADTSKPVSTAQATAIATAKAEAIADATSQVNALITGAPAALNTLDELAAALGDDANFASTVTTSLAGKTDELYVFTTDATTARVLVIGDKFKSLKFTSALATAITIPTNASVAFPIGTYVEFYQFGAGQLTVTAASPGTTSIRSTDSQNKSRTQYSSMVIVKVDTDEWLLTGDLTA